MSCPFRELLEGEWSGAHYDNVMITLHCPALHCIPLPYYAMHCTELNQPAPYTSNTSLHCRTLQRCGLSQLRSLAKAA